MQMIYICIFRIRGLGGGFKMLENSPESRCDEKAHD